ncbi:MAG: flagellar hook-associated protein 3 [Gallionellales bacterium CG_4_8_14_3_um_filter_54_18]|nr:MAG: flagellar hook-associated protein 3 [Gallionellales bacterium CG_4_8_14_3_um_filter_54_18]PJC05842.1 MAG: flagellar hook-associated protein 3 [Gallionellales bacterium CG_4_9_14_0_8_um_filter_55_61]
MRISSNTIFDSNVAAMGQQQSRLMQTQQQIASGKRLSSASTDPVAATRALDITQSDAINNQQASSRAAARHTLSLAESTLQGVTTLLQDVRTAAVYAGNGTLNSSDRATLATDLSGRLQELVGLANSTDGVGNYLFSGFQSKTQPFVDTPAGMGYFGDDGQRLAQVSATRQMAASDSGADVFMRIRNGNGTFVTQATAGNSGSGVISAGAVVNPAALTGNNYSISFSMAAGVSNYSVINTTTGLPVPGMTAQPYTSGQAITFDGMRLDIQGAPASGDSFAVTPSSNESVFKTISNLIATLNAPVVGSNLTNGLNRGINNLDNALGNVLTVRATLGLRLNEIDALQTTGEDMGLQLKQTLSQLQDVDYNKAISDLTQQQVTLQAAQKSFTQVANLSLFTYL